MTIKEFIEQYTQAKDKDEAIQSILKKEYIPFETKVAAANKCLARNITDTKMISMNTPLDYVMYMAFTLELYTTLEFDPQYPLATYNALQQYRIIDHIINSLQEYPDWREFKIVYQMVTNDFRDNHLSVKGFIQKQISKIAEVCNKELTQLNESLHSMDLKDVKNLIQSLR